MRASGIALTALLMLMLTCVTRNAMAEPPAATARFVTFSIGDLNAVALEDGTLEQPNDGKSFIVGRSPSEVAAVLESFGRPMRDDHGGGDGNHGDRPADQPSGHVFNLGHGITPDVDPERVAVLVDTVRGYAVD